MGTIVRMVVSGIALSGWVAVATAQDMPHRKPGMWEATMDSPQMKGRTVTSQQCIDEKTDGEMQKRAMQGGSKDTSCTQTSSKRLANGWEYNSVCKLKDSTLTSHAVMTGDFNGSYTMVMQGHREPARNGIADTEVTMRARYLGACSSDMKPGDMKINGMLMHSDGMPANVTPEQAAQIRKMMEQMKQQREKIQK